MWWLWDQVQTSRRKNTTSSFLENPLSKIPDSWRNLDSLENLCTNERIVLHHLGCYGGVTYYYPGYYLGHIQPPLKIKLACYMTFPSCSYSAPMPPNLYHQGYSYCPSINPRSTNPNEFLEYPTCPAGFIPELKFIDRYGWGGSELSKVTVCLRQFL